MKQKINIYEFVIQLILFILAFWLGVFVVLNILKIAPLFKSFQYEEMELELAVLRSPFGNIYRNLGVVEVIDSNVITNVLFSFVASLNGLAILFLLVFAFLLFLNFLFIKWNILVNNLKGCSLILLAFLCKYILFGSIIMMFYKQTMNSLCLSLILGSIVYIIASLVELLVIGYWLYQFVYAAINNIKILKSQM